MKLAGQLLESRSQFLGVMLNRMRMTAGGYLRKNAEAMAEYAEHTTAFGGTDTGKCAEQAIRAGTFPRSNAASFSFSYPVKLGP